jgi:hypothetical protein
MTKKERKKYGLLPTKIAESDTISVGHGLCGSGGSIYNKNTSQTTLSAFTHNDRYSQWSIQDLLHYNWLAHYSRGEFNREFKPTSMCDNYGIKAKPNKSQNQHYTSKCNH